MVDYIKKNDLNILRLICDFSFEQAMQLVRPMYDLEELSMTVEHKEWLAKDLVRFLDECEDVEEVCLFIKVNPRYLHRVRSRIGPMWNITKDRDGFFKIEKNDIIYIDI